MQAAPARRSYQTLEGMRAVGALMVVIRHVPALFGPITAPESFLAVDLFYLVSGFVVAHAYGERLRAGGFLKDFMKTRVIRLYPLYLLGLAIGVVVAAIAVITDPAGWWNPAKLAEAIAAGLFMIPFFPGLGANGSSLDGPTWTLLPELIANLVYALAVRFLSIAVLSIIVVGCACGVIFAEHHYGTLDVGYGPTDQWAALVRVGFSFFAGALMFRLIGTAQRNSNWIAWGCVAILAAALAARPGAGATPIYEIAMILFGFPALLALAGRFEPGARSGRLFAVFGLSSYSIYILHQPLGTLATRFLKIPGDARDLIFGAAFIVLLTALASWLDKTYDAPVRRALRARFLPAPK